MITDGGGDSGFRGSNRKSDHKKSQSVGQQEDMVEYYQPQIIQQSEFVEPISQEYHIEDIVHQRHASAENVP